LPEVFSAKNFVFNHPGFKQETSDDTINKAIGFYKLIRKYDFFNGWDIDRVLSAFCVKNHIPDEKIHYIFKEVYGDEYSEKETQYIIERTKEKIDFVPGVGSLVFQAKQLLNSGKLTEDEASFVKDFLRSIVEQRKDRDIPELPFYLTNVVGIYQFVSVKMDKPRKGTYYEEVYYIERREGHVITVWYVPIEAGEPNAIYKEHKLKQIPKRISVKIDIKRTIKEKKRYYEVIINEKYPFTPHADFKNLEDLAHEIAAECGDLIGRFDIQLFQDYIFLKLQEYKNGRKRRN
jgi:hypothetical protein